jgi:pimeloyl-ACP methyl ester carboxylesterase
MARDLHRLCGLLARPGPFVLTGHSTGGPYITTYTQLYGDGVSGLVYVNGSHPDQIERYEAALDHSKLLCW